MGNLTAIIIVGVYTVIYLIVFFVQRSEINKLKEINSSMKSFMEIFDIDEVKKYVELRDESTWMEVDITLKEIITDIEKKRQDELTKAFEKEMGEEYGELANFAVNILSRVPKEVREEFMENILPKTKRYLLKFLEEMNNQKKGEK